MAVFYPTIEKINQFKVQPTDGERALLDFLERILLDDSFEVYFNPFLNGDRPDILIMRKGYGVMVIEVKDWNLNNFHLNEKRKWVYTPNNSIVKSPIDQVLKYKNNLFNLHVEDLLQFKIKDFRHFNVVSCAIYFHCACKLDLEEMLITPYKDDKNYQTFLKYNIDFLGYDSLNQDNFNSLLQKRYLIAGHQSMFFTDKLYDNFKRLLSPPLHLRSQGISYNYSTKQKEIIYSTTLEQRVRGVFGSGKTTVLAARAVQAYKRALSRNNNPRILILTFNITLKNFIHDKMNRVDEEFPFENFTIINYHQFINAEMNNLNVEFEVPEDLAHEHISEYLETHYYGNIKLFEKHKDEIKPYDAVLIDEIQDYHRSWMDIVKSYFRDPQGDYVLFGDVKQNIYGQTTQNKDVVTNVRGVNELKYCYRSNFKVRDLAQSFQKNVFGDKYDVDDFSENGTYPFFGLEQEKEGYINYMYLQDVEPIIALYNIIRGNILNKNSNVSPNDITILGYTTNMLRTFDLYYRYASREKTNSMLETIETMYMAHLNYIDNKTNPHYGWFDKICAHFKKKIFSNRQELNVYDKIKIRQRVAILFSIYDLYTEFTDVFKLRLEEECQKCEISLADFNAFRDHYLDILSQFKKEVYNDNYKYIRDNKKLNFWMNSGTLKISTINSFKGWESEVVFLILEPKYATSTSFNLSFDELLYTGLTRCRRNLIVINFGNNEYDAKIRPIIEKIKSPCQ